jgi:hypothetical protein
MLYQESNKSMVSKAVYYKNVTGFPNKAETDTDRSGPT